MKEPLVYTSPWLVPVAGELIADGAVALECGQIVAVGHREEVAASYPGCRTTAFSGLMLPPLCNAHMHLELSHLGTLNAGAGGMASWIIELLQRRSALDNSSQIAAHARQTLQRQRASGVALCCDIANDLQILQQLGGDSCFHGILELVAPSHQRAEVYLQQLAMNAFPPEQAVSPHAIYSCTADLLEALKGRCRAKGQIFSIHLAESPDEVSFIRSGRGPFVDQLHGPGGCADLPAGRGMGPVEYLDMLGLLDSWTLCVHCTQLEEEEIALLARRGAAVCLCPGSNQHLDLGIAPLEGLLAVGILPALGTDSCTSNPSLDMWEEMQLLSLQHPQVAAEQILSMATLGGAKALHRPECGQLRPGCAPLFLVVEDPRFFYCPPEELVSRLVKGGRPQQIRLIDPYGNVKQWQEV